MTGRDNKPDARPIADKTSEEDLALVQAVLARDPAACQRLYDTYAPQLLRRLYRLTSNEQDAEDGLQYVMMEAFRTLERYRGDGPLGAWLNRIATNTAMDVLRKRQRWRAFVERLSPERETDDVGRPPDSLFAREETRALVWKMVQRLPPHKRMAVMLCDLEGMTSEAAADELGVPHGTLISRLYSGRRELKRLFDNESQRSGISSGDWFP